MWHYEGVAVPSTIVSPGMPAGEVHAAMIWAPVIVEIAVPLECAPPSVPQTDGLVRPPHVVGACGLLRPAR